MRTRFLPIAALLGVTLVFGLMISQLASSDSGAGPASGDDSEELARGGQQDTSNAAVREPGEAPALPGTGGNAFGGDSEEMALGVPKTTQTITNSDTDDVPDSGGGELSQPQVLDRQIIRTTTLEMTVDDVPGAVQRIETATTAAGGFVSGSSLTVEQQPPPEDPDEEQEVRQRATVTIRVPAENYTSVMNSIRGIVEDPTDITSLTEETSEVTEEYADLQARLRNLEATETQYLELLGQAEGIGEVLQVQDRLNSTRLEIEQVQGRIQLLDDLVSMATITAQLSLPPLATETVEPEPQLSWAEEAWENAWNASEEVLETVGVAAITAGVFLSWLIVPGAVILGGWWAFVGRRRAGGEAA